MSSGRLGPPLVEVTATLHICAHRILTMSFFGVGASGTAVARFYFPSVCPAVSHHVPRWFGGAPMGRALLSRSVPSGWTAILQLGHGCCQAGNNFHLLLVCGNHLVNGVVLLNGCVRHQVMPPSSLPGQFLGLRLDWRRPSCRRSWGLYCHTSPQTQLSSGSSSCSTCD
jgi:hypothetical protein